MRKKLRCAQKMNKFTILRKETEKKLKLLAAVVKVFIIKKEISYIPDDQEKKNQTLL